MQRFFALFLAFSAGCVSSAPGSDASLRIEVISMEPSGAGSGAEVTFELINEGQSPITYRGNSPNETVPLVEVKSWRGWRALGFVCYTEMGEYRLEPGQRQRFKSHIRYTGSVRIGLEIGPRPQTVWNPGVRIAAQLSYL